jgi:hypothetical protein
MSRYIVLVPLPWDGGSQVVNILDDVEPAQAICEAIVIAGAESARVYDRQRDTTWRYTAGRRDSWWEIESTGDPTARDDEAYQAEWSGLDEA